jgi:hypothetical protein
VTPQKGALPLPAFIYYAKKICLKIIAENDKQQEFAGRVELAIWSRFTVFEFE